MSKRDNLFPLYNINYKSLFSIFWQSPTHSSNQSPDEVEDGTSVQQTDGAASTPIPEVETMFVPVKEITPVRSSFYL